MATADAFTDIARLAPATQGERRDGLGAVQDHLVRFGYLGEQEFARDEIDTATSEALARYQEMMGQPVTGDFDAATRGQMAKHRCGLPDVRHGVRFATTCSWDRMRLTYAFETGTGDATGEFDAVRRAFATWSRTVPLTFVQVGTDDNPDIVVDWRAANDPDLSMVGGVLAHADFPSDCSVVTPTLPKPLHFDDSEHLWVDGSVSGGFDIETVALHEIGHLIGLAHSDVSGSVMFPTVSDDTTKRALRTDDIDGAQDLYGPAVDLLDGVFTIRQTLNGRHLDAHESSAQDFSVVTRAAQNDATQHWRIHPVGGVYVVQQRSSRRFLDAHQALGQDFSVVTRTAQDDATQTWAILADPPLALATGRIVQLSNGRSVDAHEDSAHDFSVVTRSFQDNDTQRFVVTPTGRGTHTIRQVSSGRFLDAHESAANDFSVVTRTAQDNTSQEWVLTRIGAVCTVEQVSSGRYLDAHEDAGHDFDAVTRRAQYNSSQLWAIVPVGRNAYTMQQVLNGRFLDAYEDAGHDYSAVTRTAQDDNSQRWQITPV